MHSPPLNDPVPSFPWRGHKVVSIVTRVGPIASQKNTQAYQIHSPGCVNVLSMSSLGTSTEQGPDETTLIEQLRRGDAEAFEILVRTHSPRMLAVARRIVRNDDDAQDVVQDAFIAAFRKIDGFKGDAKPGTWLHRIVVNAALMKLRSAKSKKETPIDDLLPQYKDDGHRVAVENEWQETGDIEAERNETRTLVRGKIDELPDDFRTVLLLRDVEQMDTKETAAQLGVSTAVVKTRLHRARQALRGLLDPHFRTGNL